MTQIAHSLRTEYRTCERVTVVGITVFLICHDGAENGIPFSSHTLAPSESAVRLQHRCNHVLTRSHMSHVQSRLHLEPHARIVLKINHARAIASSPNLRLARTPHDNISARPSHQGYEFACDGKDPETEGLNYKPCGLRKWIRCCINTCMYPCTESLQTSSQSPPFDAPGKTRPPQCQDTKLLGLVD